MPGIASIFLVSPISVFDLLRLVFDGLRRVAIGADAERILSVDLEQVGSLVKNVGDGFVVHWQDKGKRQEAVRARKAGDEAGELSGQAL